MAYDYNRDIAVAAQIETGRAVRPGPPTKSTIEAAFDALNDELEQMDKAHNMMLQRLDNGGLLAPEPPMTADVPNDNVPVGSPLASRLFTIAKRVCVARQILQSLHRRLDV